MLGHMLPTALGALAVTATLVPTNSSDPVNRTIDAYIDPVLKKTATDPPSSVSYAAVNFTNGLRDLSGSYFHFTEMPGTASNLTTVMIQFAFEGNLSTTNNIFAYHIHENPIEDGDNTCISAGGHYDPFHANGTEGLLKNAKGVPNPLYHPSLGNLSTFQVGDLAGKWGALASNNGKVPERTIFEHYVRLSGEFNVVGRSIVVHDAPTDTRIACGNITQVHSLSSTDSDSAASSSSSSDPRGSDSSSSSSSATGSEAPQSSSASNKNSGTLTAETGVLTRLSVPFLLILGTTLL